MQRAPGPPPIVHLRRGETLRRYLRPGLEDGKTFVFWGRNYNTGDIAGPERDLTWVNQPDKMHGSQVGTPPRVGQARYGNAVYTYRPDFTEDYREGVLDEDDRHWCLAVAYHALGRRAEAETELAKLKALDGEAGAFFCAEVYAQWGERAAALQSLATAVRLHNAGLRLFKVDWPLDPVRNEAQFQRLERQLKFPP